MHRWIVSSLILSCLILGTAVEGQAKDDPGKVVEKLQAGLIGIMKEGPKLGYAGRFQQIGPLVKEAHLLSASARIALGPHWQALNAQQRARFIDTFTTLSIATYADNFTKYSGEEFKIKEVQSLKQGQHLVRSVLLRPGHPDVHFDYYLLDQTGGTWKIVNIVVDGVSDLALKRSEYGSVMEKEGFDALLKKMNQKIKNFKETSNGNPA